MNDLISRQAAIDTLSFDKEMLSRALDDMDVVDTEREKYSWGLGLIESNIYDIEELPSAQQCMTATSNTMMSETVKIPVMDGTTERLPTADVMDDLIKRQDAITAYCEHECGIKGMTRENCGATDCGTIFDDIPTADVVEVVRCRDCKYATYDKSIDSYDCHFWSGDHDQYTEANDFCSYGERSDE